MELKQLDAALRTGEAPSGWKLYRLGDHVVFLRNGTNSRADLMPEGAIKYLHYGDIHALTGVMLAPTDLPSLSAEKAKTLDRLQDGDLILADASEDLPGVSKSVELYRVGETEVVAGLHTIAARFNKSILADGFKCYLQFCSPFVRQLRRLAAGTKVYATNRKHVASIEIYLPDVKEQKRIAEALSDVDALLEGLERLIAKKRDVKQGAMQQLLTGQTRLPGFEEEWETVKFSELSSPNQSRIDPSRSEPEEFCVELENIKQGAGRLLGWSITTSESSLKATFEAGDVLFGKLRAYLRKYWLAKRSGVCSTEIWVLKPNLSTVTSGYLYQLVTTAWFIEAAGTTYGTHMPRSDWKVVRELELRVPRLEEQSAIETVLSDMDAGIEALEQRHAKIAELKQAMMQELLTGKTRLVEPQIANVSIESESDQTKGHSWAFNEAVVIATLVSHYGKEGYPLGRKRYTKLSYLLHRRAERQAAGYLKKGAGPYNPKTRYGGPERIALQNGYVREHKAGKYRGFVAADQIDQAERYFRKWYGSDALQWLDQFRFKTNDELEVLTTVDMAVEELRTSGKKVNIRAVKGVIRSDREWKAKLPRAVFSDENIAIAIKQSEALAGFDAEVSHV